MSSTVADTLAVVSTRAVVVGKGSGSEEGCGGLFIDEGIEVSSHAVSSRLLDGEVFGLDLKEPELVINSRLQIAHERGLGE